MQTDLTILDIVTVPDEKPFDIGPNGLIVNGAPTFEQWRKFGDTLRDIKNAVQWAVGDWINYGETHYGEKYAQALDETKYAYGTLRNYASIAERVDLSHRVTGLSWSHHAAVAPLSPDEQTEVLQEAKHSRLGRDDVKELVDKKLGRSKTTGKPAPAAQNRAEFEAHWYEGEWDVSIKDGDTICQLKHDHPDATVTVVVTWPAPR